MGTVIKKTRKPPHWDVALSNAYRAKNNLWQSYYQQAVDEVVISSKAAKKISKTPVISRIKGVLKRVLSLVRKK